MPFVFNMASILYIPGCVATYAGSIAVLAINFEVYILYTVARVLLTRYLSLMCSSTVYCKVEVAMAVV